MKQMFPSSYTARASEGADLNEYIVELLYHFDIQAVVVAPGREAQQLLRTVEGLLLCSSPRWLLLFRQLEVEGGDDVPGTLVRVLLLRGKVVHAAADAGDQKMRASPGSQRAFLALTEAEPTWREAWPRPGPLASPPLLWQL